MLNRAARERAWWRTTEITAARPGAVASSFIPMRESGARRLGALSAVTTEWSTRLASRGTVKSMTPVCGVRIATVIVFGFGGIVLLAIGLGAGAGRLATPGRVFLVAALVTAAAAFAGGILAEPVLRRWAARPRRGRPVDLEPRPRGRA